MHLAVQRVIGFGDERRAVEAELERHAVLLPLQQRAEWQRLAWAGSTMLVARDGQGIPVDAVSVSISPSRAIPLHRVYRIERLTVGRFPDVRRQLLGVMLAEIANDPRCLRASVELLDPDREGRQRLHETLGAIGFVRSPSARMYRHTLVIDLRPPVEEVFAAITPSARRNVKFVEKRAFQLHPIFDPALGPQVEALSRAAFNRTGSGDVSQPWSRLIELSALHPDISRIVGLFQQGVSPAKGLVSFAWGCANGEYTVYEAAGSMRRADLRSTPLGHAPLWDLIAWARTRTSSAWFDLGGVSSTQETESLPGIATFKRYFSKDLVDVGEEWEAEPHAMRAKLAGVLRRTAGWASRIKASLRPS